jgi:hypothetical protein
MDDCHFLGVPLIEKDHFLLLVAHLKEKKIKMYNSMGRGAKNRDDEKTFKMRIAWLRVFLSWRLGETSLLPVGCSSYYKTENVIRVIFLQFIYLLLFSGDEEWMNLPITWDDSIPKQCNGYDCGLYIIRYMHDIATEKIPMSFKPVEITRSRVLLVYKMLTDESNEVREMLEAQ